VLIHQSDTTIYQDIVWHLWLSARKARLVSGDEDLMADHRTVLASIADWLGSIEAFGGYVAEWDVDRSASLVGDELHHLSIDDDCDGHLLREHRELTELLSALEGRHQQFDPGPRPAESPWTTDVLASRRELRLSFTPGSEEWERMVERMQTVGRLEAELAAATEAFASTEHARRDPRGAGETQSLRHRHAGVHQLESPWSCRSATPRARRPCTQRNWRKNSGLLDNSAKMRSPARLLAAIWRASHTRILAVASFLMSGPITGARSPERHLAGWFVEMLRAVGFRNPAPWW
jgi:hypothetical protein